ncbi:MAG TPA: ribokinase [Alloacidobacterium sp.]|nr:ribokinase [Alloacidobacterium sp.]
MIQSKSMLADKKPIVVVGSINIDLVTHTTRIPVEGETIAGDNFQIHPGGKGANQAVAVARLGYPVRMIGCLGNDTFGETLRDQLEIAGVDIESVETVPGSSGVAMIVVSDDGENCIIITPGANAQLAPADLDKNIETIRSAALVLTQLEIPLETVLHLATICTHEGVPLMLDPAPARELPEELLRKVSWLTPNETEAAFFTNEQDQDRDSNDPVDTAEKIIASGARNVALKLGARGAYVASSSGPATFIPSFSVTAVDTTAAGDAFNGAFAVALAMNMEPAESARFAAAAAAVSVTRSGAQPSMPTMAEVEQMLNSEIK